MSNKPPPGHFRLLYFASAASFTGKASDDIPASLPISDLVELIDKKYPGIGKAVLSTAAVTVNLDYVDVENSNAEADDSKEKIIEEGDEVAIIPPVSSG